MDAAILNVVFRRYRDKAKLSGFTCRDSRHTAATRIAQNCMAWTFARCLAGRSQSEQ